VVTFLDVQLIGPTLRNGRIYFDTKDKDFFPADSYGDREGEKHGIAIEFVLGSQVLHSDIRYLSASRIGPRKSLSGYFKSVRAEEGKKLRVTRLADRKYKVEYLP
jgi:hypothetical protein